MRPMRRTGFLRTLTDLTDGTDNAKTRRMTRDHRKTQRDALKTRAAALLCAADRFVRSVFSSRKTGDLAPSHWLLYSGVPHHAAVPAMLHAPKERFMPIGRFISCLAGFIARSAAIRPIRFAASCSRGLPSSPPAPVPHPNKNFSFFSFPA